MGQGTDNAQLGEKRDAAGALKLRGGARQVRPHAGQRDLRGVGLENDQVSFQLFEGQAALLVETSGVEQVADVKPPLSTFVGKCCTEHMALSSMLLSTFLTVFKHIKFYGLGVFS